MVVDHQITENIWSNHLKITRYMDISGKHDYENQKMVVDHQITVDQMITNSDDGCRPSNCIDNKTKPGLLSRFVS